MIYTNQIAGYVALLFFIAGSIVLHLRLRNYWSLSFIASIVGILVWVFWLSGAVHHEFYYPLTNEANDVTAMRRFATVVAAIEAVLMLWFGISFLFAAKSIRPQRAA
ncbi:hypothetical protein [Luteimonas sp. A501]